MVEYRYLPESTALIPLCNLVKNALKFSFTMTLRLFCKKIDQTIVFTPPSVIYL